MDIGGPYNADTPRFYVVIEGKRMTPFGTRAQRRYGVAPYRFSAERARQEVVCTELNNKVMHEDISIEPVEVDDVKASSI